MLSTRNITLVAALCILGLASVAGAQSWGDKLKDAAAAAGKDVESDVTQAKDAMGGKAQDAADTKDAAAKAAADAKPEAPKAVETQDVDVAAPAAPADPTERLGEAAKTGAVTATDAAAKGADMGSAAQEGGAAAINKYMGGGEAAAAPADAAVEAAGEAAAPKTPEK